MAIRLPCPRCKKPLSVPNKKAGSYVNCPLCNGRLWVPKDSQADAVHLDEVVAQPQAGVPAPPESAPARPGSPTQLPPAASPATLAKVLTPPGATSPVNPNSVAAAAAGGTAAPGPAVSSGPGLGGPAIAETGVGGTAVGAGSAGGVVAGGVAVGGAAGHLGTAGGAPFAGAGIAAPPPNLSAGYGQSQPPAVPPPSVYGSAPQTAHGYAPPVAPPVVGPSSYSPKGVPGVAAAGVPSAGGAQPSAVGAAPGAGAPPQPPPVVTQTGAVPADKPKVPRFISADAALSRLQLASDGRLPQLHLHETSEEPKEKQTTRSVNPLLLFALLGASVLASILMVLVDSGGSAAGQGRSAEEAWQIIEGEYFGDPDRPQRPQRYQELLRDAQRARNRGDIETQNKLLREVLAMLDAEPHPNDRGRGLTGSPGRDKRLRQQIIVLLREK